MARLNNPFVVYGYKGPEYFCDRVAESNKICSALRNERNARIQLASANLQHLFVKALSWC